MKKKRMPWILLSCSARLAGQLVGAAALGIYHMPGEIVPLEDVPDEAYVLAGRKKPLSVV